MLFLRSHAVMLLGCLVSGPAFISLNAQVSSQALANAPMPTTSNPKAGELSLPQIQKLIAKGDYEQAKAALLALRSDSEPPGVERTLGGLYYSEGQLTEADDAYTKALQQDPADREATEMRGMVLFRTGRPAEAIPYLEKANGWLAAINADANYVLALCYMQTNQYDLARKAFATIYGFAPDSADAYLLGARMLLRQDFVPVAKQFAGKALELRPNIPRAHELLGEIALSQQDLETARAEFDKERELDPLNPSVYDRLGDAYLRQQKYDDAQRSLNKAVLLDPYSSGPLILLGKTLLKQGQPIMAEGFLTRAIHMDPGNYMAHNLLGQAYRAVGRTEDASRESQAAVKLQNTNDLKSSP